MNVPIGFRPITNWLVFGYAVSLSGTVINLATGEKAHQRTDRNLVYLPDFREGHSDDLMAYSVGSVVAAGWWRKEDETPEVVNSKYYVDIINARAFFAVSENDRRLTGDFSFRLGRYWITRDGKIWADKVFRQCLPTRGKSGYWRLTLGRRNGVTVHRLVAEAFIPVPINLRNYGYTQEILEVNHIDGNKDNNHVDNLEWVTTQGNMTHASQNDLVHTDIPDDLLELVWKRLSEGKSDGEIATALRIPAPTISNIRRKVSPRYDTDRYTWPEFSPLSGTDHERNKRIIDDYNSGKYTYKEICVRNNCAESHIAAVIKQYPELVTRVTNKKPSVGSGLDDNTLNQVFMLLSQGKSNIEIEAETGVSSSKVANIRARRLYKKQGAGWSWPEPKKIDSGSRKDTEEKYRAIVKMLEDGASYKEIRQKFNCYDSMIVKARKYFLNK